MRITSATTHSQPYRFYLLKEEQVLPLASNKELEYAMASLSQSSIFIKGVISDELISLDEVLMSQEKGVTFNRKGKKAIQDAIEALEVFGIQDSVKEQLKQLIA